MKNAIQAELTKVFGFIGLIWLIFVLQWMIPSLTTFGIVPRTVNGMVGIAAMPFLHGSTGHLIGNTVPLFILLVLLAGSKANSWEIVIGIILIGGVLLWALGRPAIHIGASGLVYGLIAFLIVSGFLERRIIPLIVTIIVGFIYGGTLLWGVIPSLGSPISWDGHLSSAIAGSGLAFALVRNERPESELVSNPRDRDGD